MNEKLKKKPVNQEVVVLYTYIGEAVCAIQHLEDHLSCSIVMKTIPQNTPKKEADAQLEKRRRLPLGSAIKEAKKKKVFSDNIQIKLEAFLPKRNWLIHGGISRYREEQFVASVDKNILEKVKALSNEVNEIFHLLETDLLSYCESNGRDMSKVRAAIEVFYS